MKLTSILADIDATAARHPALDRAAELAERCRARLTIVDVLPEVPRGERRFVTGAIERELVDHRKELLASTAARLRYVRTRVAVLRGRPAVALTREVLRGRHDLLVRAHARDLDARRPFGPADVQLVRLCPCPVWLVGPGRSGRSAPVIAAVNIQEGDVASAALNQAIVDAALTIHDYLDGTLVLLQVWSAVGERVLHGHMPGEQIAAYVEETRKAAAADLRRFADSVGNRLDDARLMLVKGEPETVIPAFARRRRAAVVVMGTVARKGAAAMLIGNTAERVLRKLGGSVLAIKPPGFRLPPPVARRAEHVRHGIS